MKLAEQRHIDAAPDIVWAAMLNPEVLQHCVPGCESLTGSADEGFEAVVVQKVGPVKARFTGKVTLSDIVEGRSLRISGEGQGGVAGYARGGANVTMAPAEGGGTTLTYEVDANVGGKIAQLGNRIIDGFARTMAGQFFDRFQQAVETPETAEGDAVADGDTATEQKKTGWFRRLIG